MVAKKFNTDVETKGKGIFPLNLSSIKDLSFSRVDDSESLVTLLENPKYTTLQHDLNKIKNDVEAFIQKVKDLNYKVTSENLTSKDYRILSYCKLNLGLTVSSGHLYVIDRFDKNDDDTYYAVCHELEVISSMDCKGVSDGTLFNVQVEKVTSKKVELENLTIRVSLSTLNAYEALFELSKSTLLVDYYTTEEIELLIEPIADEILSNLE